MVGEAIKASPWINVPFLIALAATAILTPIHGDGGTAEEIGERSEWMAIHIMQIFTYSLMGVAALAFATTPGRGGAVRFAMALLCVGALYAGVAHIVDGPMRVAMIDAGLSDADTLYSVVIDGATWGIVAGYAFIGLGGALFAGTVASQKRGVGQVFAVLAMVLYVVGGTAGLSELGYVPGILFLTLTLAWIWTAVHMGLELRSRPDPSSAPAARRPPSAPTRPPAPRAPPQSETYPRSR